MRWYRKVGVCAVAAALVLWSWATSVPTRSGRWPPAANRAVEARAAVPLPAALPAALMEPKYGGTPARLDTMPMVPAPVLPQLCTPAWNAGAPTTRCGAYLKCHLPLHNASGTLRTH
jgi:hypothetical protein